MKNYHLKLLVASAAVLAFLFLASVQEPVAEPGERSIVIGGKEITVLVADTEPLRTKGLGSRESLVGQNGMLFIFPEIDRHGIWMKDMLFPIDIFWMDEAGKIVDLAESVAPETFPEIFVPRENARYVLETEAGFAQKEKINIGGMVFFKLKNE